MKQLQIKGKIFGLLASLLFSMSAMAQEEVKLVIHNHYGDEPVEISVYDVRKITFQDSYFTMVYEDGIKPDEQFVYDDVRKITFKNLITGIDDVAADETLNGINIKRNGSVISVEGIEGKAQLMIFDLAGRPVFKTTVCNSEEINTEILSPGVYILKVNNKTYKFNKF